MPQDHTSNLVSIRPGLPLISETIEESLEDQQCAICSASISTMVSITVNNQVYHRTCYVCGKCGRVFEPSDDTFPGTNDTLLCDECKVTKPNPITEYCQHCKNALGSDTIIALGNKWHVECFVCMECNCVLTDFFRDVSGEPYCEPCWLANYAKMCKFCGDGISEQVMTIEGHDYHVQCVKCAVCKKTFDRVLDILTIDNDFWHVDCFNEGESEASSIKSSVQVAEPQSNLPGSNTKSSQELTDCAIPSSVSVVDLAAVSQESIPLCIDKSGTGIPANGHVSKSRKSQCCAVS